MIETGRIVSINQAGEDITADVRSQTGDIIPNARFSKPLSGFISSPQEKDFVLYTKTPETEYYILGIVNQHIEEVGDLSRNSVDELVLNFDGDNQIRIRQEGGEHHIDIEFQGDVYLNSTNGDVYIGDENNATPVAKQNHTHTDSEGGQTTTPNEDGTEVLIE